MHCSLQEVLQSYNSKGNNANTALYVYTLQSFVYQVMNECLRSDNTEILRLFAPYIYQLIEGINVRQHYHGTVYRGIQLKQHLIGRYAKGTVFFWPGFTSSSQDKTKAMSFGNCLFEIQIPRRFAHSCADISVLSKYQSEKEVLIQPYCSYRVLQKEYNNQLQKFIIKLIVEATCYNLSGIWVNHDTQHHVNSAGIYFVAQYGKHVFWFGKRDKANWDFANVGHGTIESNFRGKGADDDEKENKHCDVLRIKWADLPIAHDKFCGELKLKIANDYQSMHKTYDSNGIFWGDKWVKKSNIFLDSFDLNVSKIKWQSDNGLSGVWKGNYGGIYVVSDMMVKNVRQISWIGYSPNGSWAHIAFGTVDKNVINVTWGDLLVAMDRYNGTLKCVLESNQKISMAESSPAGIFLTRYITKM